jgi:hypothetical protein
MCPGRAESARTKAEFDTPAAMLLRKAAEVLVQSRHAALEPHAIMNRGIERHVLKHVEPCGVLA